MFQLLIWVHVCVSESVLVLCWGSVFISAFSRKTEVSSSFGNPKVKLLGGNGNTSRNKQ